ncbi:LutC/YkgG family protein [Polymorphum gilvum]|uniref:LUD domain-containing protein n=1 Tax=Polymorphum gilvum (strain LMG 25793 / CGMCC 1.9160 / SL003B-26A1) TaxID=991905 RepID=F2J0W0_POLGS|nr:lactate utilization protein [Polymorphum gilvum]ADZ71906.1 hypothetical protein SL003B_3484 [Polymorphum gilvum SL003B-26A1]
MTTTARTAILAKIRASLGRKGSDPDRRAAVAARLADAPRGLVPARGQLPPEDRVELFVRMAESVQASTERLASAEAVPAAISAYLRQKNLPHQIRIGADPRLAELDWTAAAGLEVTRGHARASDLVTVSHALAGVAETGTLALVSGTDNPTTLNFLPEHHIVVIPAANILGDLESVWDRLRTIYGKGTMPRTVNFITGPSRSADIEQTLLLGAHGPRALHILVVGPAVSGTQSGA